MKKNVVLFILSCLFLHAYAEIKVVNMKVCNLVEPLGIDQIPVFSWQMQSDERGFKQKSYEIKVYDENEQLVWNSGTVISAAQNNITYKGENLLSRMDYVWTVKVTGESGEISEETESTFATALMTNDEWTAQWITASKDAVNAKHVITFETPFSARWLMIDVTRLGIPVSTEPNLYYLQLSEVEIFENDENVALTAAVTASHNYNVVDKWDLSYINDGKIINNHLGFTSNSFSDADQHLWVKFDFGQIRTIDKIILYPRQDEYSKTSSNLAANFPASFTILSSSDDSDYSKEYSEIDMSAPEYFGSSTNVPYYGCNFIVRNDVKKARAYVSALGVFTMAINGLPVTENKLEPGESEYTKSVLYSTYDITNLLEKGQNTVIAQVAGGIFNVNRLSGIGGLSDRYSKELTNSGESSLRAELFIEYTDGTTEYIVTDDKWKTTKSPTIGSNWWGGEDYDARLEIDGIKNADMSLNDWNNVTVVSPSFASSQSSGKIGQMRSRMYEPLRIVEEWNAISVNEVYSGGETLYVVDFGKNFAGQYKFNLKGNNGQVITLRTGHLLNADGTIKQEIFNTPPFDIYDSYTFKGGEQKETWGPTFMYHGTRYLQIRGLDSAPSPEDFTAYRIRSDVSETGYFETSNALINNIHIICRDAIQSQIYNTITDCPHRERLGWLDVPNEMYNSICYNYDMSAFWNKVVLDCFDAQYPGGKVPSTVPHFWGDWDDDPNWGGSAIFLPYRMWKTYGDKTAMAKYYDGIKMLIDYYSSLTTNYIMPGSSYSALSDWGQNSSGLAHLTSAEFTITTTYYYLLNAVSEIASELGYYIDAYYYSDLAKNVKEAFNDRFYDEENGVYDHGNQGEYGMSLYYGLVDEANEELVARNLAEAVRNANYKIKTGEIALKPVLMSLAKYGYNDIVYKVANQTDYPSYGYFVVNGCTTTPEYWDMSYSQNHCMMDHIEEWFYSELGGVKISSSAFSEFTIQPWIPNDMNSMKTTVGTIYGEIKSEYDRKDDGFVFRFDIPENTNARIIIPVPKGRQLTENGENLSEGRNGIETILYTDSLAIIKIGSGTYEFLIGSKTADGVSECCVVDGCESMSTIYNLSGQPLGEMFGLLPKGIYIVNGKKVVK